MCAWLHILPSLKLYININKNKYIHKYTHTHTHTQTHWPLFGTVPQSYLRGCLPGYNPKSPNKTELTALTLCIFFSGQFWWPTKGPRADFSPSHELYEDLEPWYQQGLLCPSTCSESRRIWVPSGSWISQLLVDDPEFYLVVYNMYLAPQLKDTGICSVERHWAVWDECLDRRLTWHLSSIQLP